MYNKAYDEYASTATRLEGGAVEFGVISRRAKGSVLYLQYRVI